MTLADLKTDFLIYVIEEYKFAEKLSGKEVAALFEQHRVFTYVLEHYEALHTTGGQYIVEDINLFIRAAKESLCPAPTSC
ncbi:hypothetical protein FACS1894107_03740 [Planctomycetales bacterium]|nr:hypothetical protein FACS1894107_03740 [Planctomycetales bacterium]GHV23180.1 hypothetical protein AGMMS49959_15490 [Planctomycetales bacterium]